MADFLRGIERIGGFNGKSDVLARCEVFAGDPACYKKSIEFFEKATWPEVKNVANRWLSDGVYVLEVHPKSKFKEFSKDTDRSKLPPAGPPSPLRIPSFQRTTLSNGMKVVLAERHETPTLNLALQFDAGYAADQLAQPGTAALTNRMLLEGTAKRTGPQISERSAELGAQINAVANLDTSTVNLSALKMNLDDSLELYADIVRNPAFPDAGFRPPEETPAGNHSAREVRTKCNGAAGPPGPGVRQGACLRQPLHRQRHRGQPGQDHPRLHPAVLQRLVQTQQRHDPHRRRHDFGRD